MKTLEIYKNYGCLSAEKRCVYTYGSEASTAVCSDVITVVIPDGWEIYENNYGETLITSPWGENYKINDVLAGVERPRFEAIDNEGKVRIKRLEVIEEALCQ